MSDGRVEKPGSSIFILLGAIMLVAALIAFTPRYFAPIIGGAADIRLMLHIHAVSGLAWTLLFIGQASLIRLRRYDFHKRLGLVSLALAAAVFGSGVIVSAELYWRTHDDFAPANPILLVNLSDMTLFATAYIIALTAPKSSPAHPLGMLLAAFILMNAVVFRLIAFSIGAGAAPVFGSHIVMIVLTLVYLFWARRRFGSIPKRIMAIASLLILVTLVRIPVGFSPLWSGPAAAIAEMQPGAERSDQ